MGKMAFGAGVLVTDLRCGSAVMQMHADADHDTDTPTCFEALGTKRHIFVGPIQQRPGDLAKVL